MAKLNTFSDLIILINEIFTQENVNDWHVVDAIRTRYSQDDYESGAAKIIIKYEHKERKEGEYHGVGYFYSFYSLKELKREIKLGGKLYLKRESNMSISSAEFAIKSN